jgi:hypothetical protein
MCKVELKVQEIHGVVKLPEIIFSRCLTSMVPCFKVFSKHFFSKISNSHHMTSKAA